MITDKQITQAADQLTDTIAVKLADLADELLDRPATGSNEWLEQYRYYEANPTAKAEALREWHLTKLAIVRKAGTDPIGDVIGARENGASWQTIGDVYGISRQAAFERWAKYTASCTRCGNTLDITGAYNRDIPNNVCSACFYNEPVGDVVQ